MQAFELTDTHLRMLRKLAVSWDIAEAGAPTVEPAAPYGSVRLYNDLAPILDLPLSDEMLDGLEEPTPEDFGRAMAVHRELETAFAVLMDNHGLQPGTYVVEDRPAFLHAAGRLSWSTVDVRREGGDFSTNALVRFFQVFKSMWTARREMEQAEDAGPARVDVDITAEHLTLLHWMHPEWQEHADRPAVIGNDPAAKKLETWISEERLYPVPYFDPKRPYGDCTYYFLDMAEALGIEQQGDDDFSQSQVERLTQLHEDMQMVVQTVIQHGKPAAGTYTYGEGGWRPQS